MKSSFSSLLRLADFIQLAVHLQQFFLGEGHVAHAQHAGEAQHGMGNVI